MRTCGAAGVVLMMLLVASCAFGTPGFGVKAGGSWATQEWIWPTTEFDTDLDFRTGFRAGAYAEFELTPWLSLVPEVHYVQLGARYAEVETWDLRYDYVAIPLLVKIRAALHSWSPYAYAGPRADVFVGSQVHAGWIDDLDSVDFGVDLGAGLEISRFLLEFRYSASFTDSWSKSPIEIRNSAYGLLIGFSVY
jgi:hypothetical protein